MTGSLTPLWPYLLSLSPSLTLFWSHWCLGYSFRPLGTPCQGLCSCRPPDIHMALPSTPLVFAQRHFSMRPRPPHLSPLALFIFLTWAYFSSQHFSLLNILLIYLSCLLSVPLQPEPHWHCQEEFQQGLENRQGKERPSSSQDCSHSPYHWTLDVPPAQLASGLGCCCWLCWPWKFSVATVYGQKQNFQDSLLLYINRPWPRQLHWQLSLGSSNKRSEESRY